MEIACGPQIWMGYVSMIIGSLGHTLKYISIMDDPLIHNTKKNHWTVGRFVRSHDKNGLKMSPKKCQLFRTTLTYMGNDFKIKNRIMTITPLKTRMEAIQKYPLLELPNAIKVFVGWSITWPYSVKTSISYWDP